jgi:hypothetical protein
MFIYFILLFITFYIYEYFASPIFVAIHFPFNKPFLKIALRLFTIKPEGFSKLYVYANHIRQISDARLKCIVHVQCYFQEFHDIRNLK